MISLEKFNNKNHRNINHIRRYTGGYAVSGCLGTAFYMMYPLKEVIKMYNAATAMSMAKR